ncbi:MAG: hypothetical protein JKY34_05250 [Kordiimonadaceae bacterium]|nr:hypothetical protein [Kordiimonadaceae bacterium]
MDKYTMVVAIVFLVMATGAFKSWAGVAKQKASAKSTEIDDETKAKIDSLEERVKVLERIATDKTSRLKEEIDAL